MKILHFADLHLGVESYGRTDPATGLSTRFLDFLRALDEVVSYALDNNVDLVLFCGDAYKSREPSQTQQREFAKRIKQLSTAGVPVFLLIGNHDLPNAMGRATATEIFDTLAISNVCVSNRPDIYRIPTRSGIIQVASLPWLRRSTLLTREETKELSFEQLNERLQQVLTGVVEKHVAGLDATLPAILAAHVWVAGAQPGSERSMAIIGRDPALLLSNVARPAFDYVALGHIHKHQVLAESPPVVYSGSLERLDFNEEADDKGFCVVDIQTGPETGRRLVKHVFHKTNARRFVTVSVSVDAADTDPTATVLKAIAEQEDKTREAVVRVEIKLPAGSDARLRDSEIRSALKEAHHLTIARDIQREARLRLGHLTAEGLTPLEALKAYLQSKNVPPQRAKVLLEHGERLIGEGSV
ncbi:MAG: exonuclease SbcCD subunit D [Chloroflexi bacterium]|nr:exonuclease SbcCD subunit D [Chloroflexota bacterium]